MGPKDNFFFLGPNFFGGGNIFFGGGSQLYLFCGRGLKRSLWGGQSSAGKHQEEIYYFANFDTCK